MKINIKSANNWIHIGPEEVWQVKEFCKLHDKKDLILELKVKSNSRSVQANKFYWGAVIKAFENINGLDSQSNHRLLKEQFLKYRRPESEIEVIRKIKEKHNLSLLESDTLYIKSTTELTSFEFFEYVNRCILLLIEYGGSLDVVDSKEWVNIQKKFEK